MSSYKGETVLCGKRHIVEVIDGVRSFLSGREWTAPATIVSFALESEMFPSVDGARSFVYRGLR